MSRFALPTRHVVHPVRRLGVVAVVVVAGLLPALLLAGTASAHQYPPPSSSTTSTTSTTQPPQNGCVPPTYTPPDCALTVSNSIVYPGSWITVSGSGFKPGSSVQLFFDPYSGFGGQGFGGQGLGKHGHLAPHNTLLGTVFAGRGGRFSDQVQIPFNAPYGPAEIEADGLNAVGGHLVLYADVRVIPVPSPYIYLSNSSGYPGSTVTVYGFHFGHGKVTLVFDPNSYQHSTYLDTVYVDFSGNFTDQVQIPQNAQNGGANIDALGTNLVGDKASASSFFQVTSPPPPPPPPHHHH